MNRHKLRKVRARQWRRYIDYLCKLSPHTLSTPGAEKYYNYEARRFNRAQHRKALSDWSDADCVCKGLDLPHYQGMHGCVRR